MSNYLDDLLRRSGPADALIIGGETLPFGAVGEGQALVRTGNTMSGADAAGGGAATVTAAYLRRPTIASEAEAEFNDEFEDGSDVLAERSWILRNLNTGVVMTRIGPVQVFGSYIADQNQYRSTVQGDSLLLQMPDGAAQEFFLYKAVSIDVSGGPSFGGILSARVGSPRGNNNSNATGNCKVQIVSSVSGAPALANRVGACRQLTCGGVTGPYGEVIIPFRQIDSAYSEEVGQSFLATDILGVQNSGGGHGPFFINSQSRDLILCQGAGSFHIEGDCFAGIGFYMNGASGAASNIFTIDYIRMMFGDTNARWIA